MIQPTNWILSSMQAKEMVPLSEGIHNLQIIEAVFNEEENWYGLTLKSLDEEGEQSRLRYYIVKKDGTRNEQAIGTLNKVGHCLYGVDAGIPFPDDIVNGILKGHVKHTVYEGKEYVNIYTYEPVDIQTLEIAKESGLTVLDQYHYEG